MKLKKNIIANYIGQFYTIIIGIVMVPFYLKYLGVEAYGLVGFFAVVYSWLNLLKIGLTPAFSREVARFHGLEKNKKEFIQLLNSIEMIFFIFGVLIALMMFLSSEWLSNEWLNVEKLSIETVVYSISLMGVIVSLKWFSELYSAGVQGIEDQVWLNIFNVIITTLKFVGVLVILEFVSNDIQHFFEYQMVLGVIEVIILARKFYHLLDIKSFSVGFYFSSIKGIFPYLSAVAYTAFVWILLSQFDKLLLSNILSLEEYGYFVLVALISNGIIQLSTPVSKAILPRMVKLYAQDKEEEMLRIYQNYSQYVAVLIFSITAILVVFSYEFLYSWTGNFEASVWGKDVLVWYVMGSAILTITSYQYYLQVVHGKLALHVKYNTFSIFVVLPLILLAAYNYGALGVAFVWFGFRVLSFLIWVPYVHSRFAPNIHINWIKKNILPVILNTFFWVFVYKYFEIDFSDFDRLTTFILLTVFGVILLILNMLTIKNIRMKLYGILGIL